jgi:undecaprenyl-diphosphatase
MVNANDFLFKLINGVWINPTLDTWMISLSHINDYALMWLLLLAMLAIFGGRTGRRAALAGLVALGAGVAVSEVLKNLVMQPRPFLSIPDARLLVGAPTSYSFPSTNVAYAFSACVGSSLAAKRLMGRVPSWGWGSLVLAVAISYSRVYVGVHYPVDAVAGALLGVCVGWIAAAVVAKFGGGEAFGAPGLRDKSGRSGPKLP